MKVLELFSGTASFSNVFKEKGHEIFTVDYDDEFEPSFTIDVNNLHPNDILEKFGKPDVIWASPPCPAFSVAAISKYWKNGYPSNEKTWHSIFLVRHTLWLIGSLKPRWWFLENPRGMLRKMNFMPNKQRKTAFYCQYGLPYMKPTDIWTNLSVWRPKQCSVSDGKSRRENASLLGLSPCHMATIKDEKGYTRNGIFDLRWCHEAPPRGYEAKKKAGSAGIRDIFGTFGCHMIGGGSGKRGPDMRGRVLCGCPSCKKAGGLARLHRAPHLRAIVPKALCEEIYEEIVHAN